MRKIYTTCAWILVNYVSFGQTIMVSNTCTGSNGNILVFANYDGGVININVDENIPNLKIGLVSFNGVTVNISGPYASNVVRVEYAGVNPNDSVCAGVGDSSVINGLPNGSIVNFAITPPAPMMTTHGYVDIDCAFSCDTSSWQGGCNTYDQVAAYFETLMGGTVYKYMTQYSCWSSDSTYFASSATNCVPLNLAQLTETTSFSVSDSTICIGQQNIQLTNLSTSTIGTNNWTITNGIPAIANSIDVTNLSFGTVGIQTITLVRNGCSVTATVNVQNCLGLELNPLPVLEFYPNPTKNMFQTNMTFDNESIEILNVLGEKTQFLINDSENQSKIIQLLNASKGFYIVSIRKDNQILTGKILIE